jgi:hypothetical protein
LDPNPEHRPTFANLVARLESADFPPSSTELGTISQYKAEIVAELALSSPSPAGFYGCHREEIHEVLAGAFVKDLEFFVSLMTCMAGKLPCQILAARLSRPPRTGQIPQDLLQQADGVVKGVVLVFAIGLVKTYYDVERDATYGIGRINKYCYVGPDIMDWFRTNYQSVDLVNDFARFLINSRTQKQQTLISQITTLFRSSLRGIVGCQEAWDSLVRRTRAILSLPDSELYPVIAPASLQACLE